MTRHDLQNVGDGPRADRPKRRHFTADYKLRVLEEYDPATPPGAKGALLRREGLYDISSTRGREQRDAGALPRSAHSSQELPQPR